MPSLSRQPHPDRERQAPAKPGIGEMRLTVGSVQWAVGTMDLRFEI